ncbi:MAG: flagellar basal body-associated FliL family protein [Candidatus Latescibacteria bacterium]|nr:flagellar basal body-associated FliL family protein [Candidatus Latescibacterota bacterium]
MAEEDVKQEQQEKPKKAAGKPLDNKLVMLAVIIVVQAALAVGVTQFVLVPKLQHLGGGDQAVLAGSGAEGGHGQAAGKEKSGGHGKPGKHGEAGSLSGRGSLVGLKEVTVSLRSEGAVTSFLRISVDLEVPDPSKVLLVEERLPHLRDIVIASLSNKYAADLRTLEGKEALKTELLRKLGEALPEAGLMNIYFSDLVVQ